MEAWETAYEAQLDRLDPDQRRIHDDALDFTDNAPRRYLAGAGSGKTAVIITIAATAINRLGIRPEDIILGTFTNAAEAEMAHRLKTIISPENYDRMHGMAGKSRCWGVINFDKLTSRWVWHGGGRQFWPNGRLPTQDLGSRSSGGQGQDCPSVEALIKGIVLYTKKFIIDRGGIAGLPPGFRGFDLFNWYEHTDDAPMRSDAKFDGRRFGRFEWVRSRVRADGYSFSNRRTQVEAYQRAYDFAKRLDLPEDTIGGRQVDIRRVIEMVEQAKANLGAGERGDALAVFAEKTQWRFKLALFDECQDCNALQVQSALRLSPSARFIGDIRQAIYFFRGGSPETTLTLDRDAGAKTLYLPRNYRSGRLIVEAGNLICEGHTWMVGPPSVAMRDGGRLDGELLFHDHQDMGTATKSIAASIHAAVSSGERRAGDFAVLTPTNVLADMVQAALDLHALPNVRLGSRAGLWDIEKNRNTRAVLSWLALATSTPMKPANAVLTLAVPKLEAIGDKKLEEAQQYGDPVSWARQARLGPSQQRAIRDWLERVEACRAVYKEFGWTGLTFALAYVLDPSGADATLTDEGRASIGLPAQEDMDPDDVASKTLERWNDLVEIINQGQTDAQRRAVEAAAAKTATQAQDGVDVVEDPASPTLAILTTARVLGSFDALLQHAVTCQKNPVMPDDMPGDISEDPVASARWLAEVEALRASRVSISTIHGAKGLEWHTVHLCATKLHIDGPGRDLTPGELIEEREEKQRVFYVGLTRARDVANLHTWPAGAGLRGFPDAVEHRIRPMLAREARRRAVVRDELPKLTGAGWSMVGMPYGTMDCNLVAHHPQDHSLQLRVRPLPRVVAPGELEAGDPGRMAYLTPHIVELHAFGQTLPLQEFAVVAAALTFLVRSGLQLTGRSPASFRTAAQLRAHIAQSLGDEDAVIGGDVDGPPPAQNDAVLARVKLVQEYIAWVRAQGMSLLADTLAQMPHDEVAAAVAELGYNPAAPCDPPTPPPTPVPPTKGKTRKAPAAESAPPVPPSLAPPAADPAPTRPPPPVQAPAAAVRVHEGGTGVTLADRASTVTVPLPPPGPDGAPVRSVGIGLPLPGTSALLPRLLIAGQLSGRVPVELPVRPGTILIYLSRVTADVVGGEAARVMPDGTLVTLLSWQGTVGDVYRQGTLPAVTSDVARRLQDLYGPYPEAVRTPMARAAYDVGVGLAGTLSGKLDASWGLTVTADRLGLPGNGKLVFPAMVPRT